MNTASVATLHRVFGTMDEDDLRNEEGAKRAVSSSRRYRRAEFVAGLTRPLQQGLEMHVKLAPPGHVDLGWNTTFPHCPRCKAEAPVKRWQRKYSEVPIACPVCGNDYSPAGTSSSVRYDFKNGEDLREALGQQRFEGFAVRYLMAHGATELEAIEAVGEHEDWHRRQRELISERQEVQRRHDLYVEKKLSVGLENRNDPGEAGESGWLYSSEDFGELLSRCEILNIRVRFIWHVSATGEWDKFLSVNGSARKAINEFERLQKSGCREKFGAGLHVADDVVNEWWEEHEARHDATD